MQILKGLYQVGGDINGITFDQPGALWNDGNSYILKTPAGLIMFDCGCGDTMEQIFENMRYWDLSPDEIKYCLLTHPHFDHAGGAYLLKKRGVKLLAIAETAEAVASGDERCCGYLYHKTFQPVTIDQVVQDNDELNLSGTKITVMHLPGHSQGCTAYSFMTPDQKHVVVSGDVIGTLLKGDFGWSGSIDFDKKSYIASLQKFAKVDMDMMLPGHGMIYFRKPRYRVEEVLNAALMEWR
ncbi:MAG: MBL fold metallo-hydrolase [Bacteroidota bacterium]|nr:MBL fold metallo-hydrolase [Bacteroidota bacterium]